MIGARMMKPTRNAPLNVNVNNEFAAMRSRFLTSVGIIAASAGTKKIVTVATRRMTNDDEVFERVISATRMMSALVTAFAATWERIWAPQIARNARLRRMPRSAAARLAPVNAPLVGRRERPALSEPLHVLFEIAASD